ncbi:MAG: sulfurtransferase [Pseudomonadales bacterium]|nr:sulfurtransferase [Pseudomonadales bacterium]
MHTTLIAPADLAALLAAEAPVRILDCRARLDDHAFGARAYAEGHLPGAVYANVDTDFAAPPGAGGRHPLPDDARLAARLREWGIDDTDQIVTYDDAGGPFAARAWWCIRRLGHRAVAVLDGGFKAWQGELTATSPPTAPGNFSIRPPLTREIDATTLLARLDSADLVDARARPRFEGREEPIDPVAGHIPGAVCLPFQENLTPDGRFRAPVQLAERFAGHGPETICYCGSGVTAAHNILAMRIAGLPEPILYPGSWSDWIRDPARPRAP